MSLEEKYKKKCNELQKKIMLEIEKVKEGKSKRDRLHLQVILKELQESMTIKRMILSYPRLIIDSWDYSDELGIELMELAELYRKIV